VTTEAAVLAAPPTPESTGWRRIGARTEDVILTLGLAAMMVLPLLEALLRKTLGTGISGQTAIEQHLVLITGMLGGAIAARQRRLLALGSIELLLKNETARALARVFSGAVAVTVSAFLCVASITFVLSERAGGRSLPYDVPVWIVQTVLPIGFALITLRILMNVSDRVSPRVMTAVLAAVFAGLALQTAVPRSTLVVPAFVALLLATVLGAPVFTTLAGAGLILFWGEGSPIGSMSVDHYGLVTNPTLPTIPLFTLAGYFLAEGGASRRLIRLFRAAVGAVRGGPAILVTLVCAFFTSFTGASGVTILALGGLLMPILLSAGYSEKSSLGLLTGTGSLGLLFPPCLPLILYAVVAQVDILQMFLGGIVPGTLLVVLATVWGISQAPRIAAESRGFDWVELRGALWEAKWELLIPVVALVGLFGGFATPVEAAAATAFYAFSIETWVHGDLRITRDMPRVITEAGLLVGGVLLILGVALGFTNYLAFAEIPTRAVEWVSGAVHSPWTFLLLLNVFLLVVGMLMDIYSAIVIVVPLILPLGRAFGIDPVHLGIVFLANLELGFLTPPVGVNLFLSSLRFQKPVAAVFRAAIPMVIVFAVGVLLITYIPVMTTWLPRAVGR
jgi:tripartite ATP-independent transporter DctM subunit